MSDIKQQETAQQEPVVNEEKKVEITTDYLNTLYNDNPQIFEKWISDEPVAKKVLTPWKDSHVSQGINTFKEKTMPEFIEHEIEKVKTEYSKKLNPEDKWKADMEAKLNDEKNARRRAEIKSNASEYITKLGFSLNGVNIDDFLSNTEEETIEKINRFYERDKKLELTLEEKFKKAFVQANNFNPPTGENEAVPFGGSLEKMAEAIKHGKFPAFGEENEKARLAIMKFKGLVK